jgi:hypothetical protein
VKGDVTEGGWILDDEKFHDLPYSQYISGYQIKMKMLGGAYSTYELQVCCKQNLVGKRDRISPLG